MGGVDQWTSIHQDMLNQITKRFHSYDEYLQLRFVCKQWNFNIPLIPTGNKVPWLLLPIATLAAKKSLEEDNIYRNQEETLDTRSLEEKEIYHLTMPELQNNFICGSCHGWVIIVLINEGTIRMLNPFTKVCFDLPPISALPKAIIDTYGDKCTLNFEDRVGGLDMIFMHKINVWKVITNSGPINDHYFMAVVIYGPCRKLAFYRPNNRRWIKLPTSHEDIMDVIFFQEKIYAVDYDFQLYEFDIKEKLEPVRRIYQGRPFYKLDTNFVQYNYLIGCDDGSLLMLVRHVSLARGFKRWQDFETVKFDIYKLNKNAKVWSRIYDLENYVLIVGFNSSIQILADSYKGNKIYFTDNMLGLHAEDDIWRHDIGIYNLEDESCKRVLSNVNFCCSPIWILP